jgi:hypothetical protein
MAHMTLPAAHSDADFELAERIGRALGLEEVHVFWTLPVPSAPPAPAGRPASGGLLGALVALGALLERAGERIVSRQP